MDSRIAIVPDRVVHANGELQSYSQIWHERAQDTGITADNFDVYATGAMRALERYDALMWRFPPDPKACRFAHSFLNAAENGMGKIVYPDWATRWHVEDKIAQSYMLDAVGIAVPETHIIWRYETAVEYLASAQYPLVLKLASGYRSSNVCLVRNRDEARYFVDRLFENGIKSLAHGPSSRIRELARDLREALTSRRKRSRGNSQETGISVHQGYVYLQEFIPDNHYDTRITVIGNRAFGFTRYNRENDFRASGSGRIDWDPRRIDASSIETAFRVADETGASTVAVDLLRRTGETIVLELSLAFASWAVHRCPGYWRRLDRQTYETEWVRGATRPEDAIWDDFACRLHGELGKNA